MVAVEPPTQVHEKPKHDNVVGMILAAGRAKRTGGLVKPLLSLAGVPLLGHILSAVKKAGIADIIVVTPPPPQTMIADWLEENHPEVLCVSQPVPLGTGDAVRCGLTALKTEQAHRDPTVVILNGDMPFVEASEISALIQLAKNDSDVDGSWLAVCPPTVADAQGLGRVLRHADGWRVRAVVEQRDIETYALSDWEARCALERWDGMVSVGVLALSWASLTQVIEQIPKDPMSGETYLTVLPEWLSFRLVEGKNRQAALGVNTLEQLANLEEVWQQSRRLQMMNSGVRLVSPQTLWVSADTQIGKGSVVEPYVVMGLGVKIGENCLLRSFSYLQDSVLCDGVQIGPFARLRGGNQLADGVKVGNFVEVKHSNLGRGVKAGHLAYLGDAMIGDEANIGAGSVTCNFDGSRKHQTEIGKKVFVGSNTSLVAPLTIGDEALLGAGSVITKDVPARQIVTERNEQRHRPRRFSQN